ERPQHHQLALREVEDLGRFVNHDEAQCDEGVDDADGGTADHLLEEGNHRTASLRGSGHHLRTPIRVHWPLTTFKRLVDSEPTCCEAEKAAGAMAKFRSKSRNCSSVLTKFCVVSSGPVRRAASMKRFMKL